MKGIGYPLHSPVSPTLPLPYVTVPFQLESNRWRSIRTACNVGGNISLIGMTNFAWRQLAE